MIEITLPWPDKILNPNVKAHWAVKAEVTKEAKKWAYWMTGTEMNWVQLEAIKDWLLEIVFFPPDKRKRDLDNLHRQCKPYQDGVCDKLDIDDSRIKRIVLEWGEVVKGGKVVLRLEEME